MADYGKPRIKKFSSSVLERIKSNRPSVSDGPLDFMTHKPSQSNFQGHQASPFDFAGHNPVSANIDADTRREQAGGPQHPIFGGDKPPGGGMPAKQFAGHKEKDGTFNFQNSLNVKPSGNFKPSFKF